MKPEFIDNSRENTLASALNVYLDHLAEHLRHPVELRIASGYFNPAGFSLVADRLARLPRIRLLLGAEPIPPPAIPLRMPGEPRGQRFEEKRVRDALDAHAKGLVRDRDRIPFAPAQDQTVRRLVEFLRSGKVEVRRYEKQFLHGKAYIFGNEDGTIVGSSNFTFAGLQTNLELNLGDYQPHVVKQVSDWFEQLWAEAVPYDLATLYEARATPCPPYHIYLRVLWELFGNDLGEARASSELNLTSFQRDGVWRAKRILDELGGVLVADEVGLGKTFIAGDLIRVFLRENRQRVLVVAPAALRDGPWAAFLRRHMLFDAEVVSFEQLQREERLGADGHEHVLVQNPNDYALVVVDEAQALRNPDALRSRAMRALLRGAPRKKLILMSATPVNNSVWDLYTLLTYFVEHDGVFADRGITSLLRRFRNVAGQDPEDLRPDALFEVIDATTVRRTRHFIKRYYPNEKIRGPDGVEVHIRFPKPVVLPVNYDLDAALPGLFDRIRDALAPASGEPRLTLARYAPDRYRRSGTPEEARTAALVGLLRTGILKRFESSAFAFEQTLHNLMRGCDAFLKGLDEGKVLQGRGLAEIEDLSDTDEWSELISDGEWEPAAAYDLKALQQAVQGDRDLFAELLTDVEKLSAADNPKLHALDRELMAIARLAEKEGVGDEQDRRKVIIFTFFADTADWIYRHLSQKVETHNDLAVYRGRVVGVAGDQTWGGVSRDDAIFGFVPRSAEAPRGRDRDLYDVLVTTDILAEGMNLQQCRHIINFDLPWNPMRLVQRHGRVDRIGSPHDTIYLRCFFPDRRLDALLALESRLRAKLAAAAATIGLAGEVIPGSATTPDKFFSETREEIERLRQGDAQIFERSGEPPGAHSGEEFRHELRKAFEDPSLREAVLALPGAAGSVMATAAGGRPGHFFCAKIGDRVFLRFVPTDPDAPLVKDALSGLRVIACSRDTPRAAETPDLWQQAFAAWARARDDIYTEWMWATDPANVQPKIRPLFQRAAEHLRRHPPPDVPQERIRRAVEALEAPRSGRVERMVRDALDGFGTATRAPTEASLAVIERVEELGLEPYRAPPPLPEIDKDEVQLVCWMVLAP